MARPRRNAIDRFNIATNLMGERKLSKFMAVSGLTADRAWLTCARFWDFVATNYALTGNILNMGQEAEVIENPKIDPEDKYALKVHCWFDGDPDFLISCLQSAGLLDQDLTVHEWFTHQPLAEKLVRKRVAGAKGGQSNADSNSEQRNGLGQFSPSKQAETPEVLGVSEQLTPSQLLTPNSELRTIPLSEAALPLLKKSRSKNPKTLKHLLNQNGKDPPQPNGVGPVAILFDKIFRWAGVDNPTPANKSSLYGAMGKIKPEGVERMIDDFIDRGYAPKGNRLEAFLAACFDEHWKAQRAAAEKAESGKIVLWENGADGT